MLQWMWGGMMFLSILYALCRGMPSAVMEAALEGTSQALSLTLRLCAGYLLFCGWIEIIKALKMPALLSHVLRPLLRRLMPTVQEPAIAEAVSMNLSMNMLGVGNAATPMGVKAVRLMDTRCKPQAAARQDIAMLLILNATSLQLLPTTVLTLRTAAGSADPGAIIAPGLLCSFVATIAGVGAGLLCRRCGRRFHG